MSTFTLTRDELRSLAVNGQYLKNFRKDRILTGDINIFDFHEVRFENCYLKATSDKGLVLETNIKSNCFSGHGYPTFAAHEFIIITRNQDFRDLAEYADIETLSPRCFQVKSKNPDKGIFEIDVLPGNCGLIINWMTRI
jgi:hypothetical protein